MSKLLPNSVDDIDDFFRSQLENADEESAFNQMSWDKINQELDILSKLPASVLETTSSVSSITSQSASNLTSSASSSTFISSLITIKGLIMVGSAIGIVGIGLYVYFLPTQEEKTPEIQNQTENPVYDSLSVEKLNSSTDSVNVFANNQQEKTEVIENRKANNQEEIIEEGTQKSHQEENETSSENTITPAVTAKPQAEAVSTTEEKTLPEPKENIEKEKSPIEIKPQTEEPAKDFREKQLEKARKNSRPIFTPEKQP